MALPQQLPYVSIALILLLAPPVQRHLAYLIQFICFLLHQIFDREESSLTKLLQVIDPLLKLMFLLNDGGQFFGEEKGCFGECFGGEGSLFDLETEMFPLLLCGLAAGWELLFIDKTVFVVEESKLSEGSLEGQIGCFVSEHGLNLREELVEDGEGSLLAAIEHAGLHLVEDVNTVIDVD